jgi:hypothetical protein
MCCCLQLLESNLELLESNLELLESYFAQRGPVGAVLG